MTDLRKLMDHLTHIEQGGKLIRELDVRTGRIVSRPVTEDDIGSKTWPSSDAQIRAFQRANPPLEVDGLIGKKTLAVLTQRGYKPPTGFAPVADKANAGGSNASRDLGSNAAGNISDFSKGSSGSFDAGANTDSYSILRPGGIAGQNADGSFNSDHPFVKAMDAKMARNKNPNGNGGHDGSGIDPNDNPADPKTWPPGVKPAPDFGYLDRDGMWIPTPFHERDADGDYNIPRTSPANRIGIPESQLSPFQKAVQKMEYKSTLSSASAIEQSKPVKLPSGAPEIPGYKQVDPGQFSTDARQPGLDKTVDWVYAYRKGNDFILIAPQLFYNTKLSIGRHYRGWNHHGIKTDDDRVPSKNGTVFVANQSFNVNDMILVVVVNTSIGAGNIGPQILKSISGSLKPL